MLRELQITPRIWKTNDIKSFHLMSSSEWLSLSFSLLEFLYPWLNQTSSVSDRLVHLYIFKFFLSSPSALEKEAHRERHSHHNLSGAGSIAIHPTEYPLTLPACLYHRPCAQSSLWKHMLQVNVQNRTSKYVQSALYRYLPPPPHPLNVSRFYHITITYLNVCFWGFMQETNTK